MSEGDPSAPSCDAGAGQGFVAAAPMVASVHVSEKALEEKERKLRESILQKYGRIRDVERELSELQWQLKINVGPKKQALELIRRKIEEQNERVHVARAAHAAAVKAAEESANVLAAESQRKDQLCQELNLLVQQSAHAQIDKLEQLTQKLESLTTGMATADARATLQPPPQCAPVPCNGAVESSSLPNPEVEATKEQVTVAQSTRSAHELVPRATTAPAGGPATEKALDCSGSKSEHQAQLAEHHREAALARSRHVSVGSTRRPATVPQPVPAASGADRQGRFTGFD